ncbi:MAG: low molecular weight protein arginine phosphatase [Chloroflexi bacterium]|nr:low molecular weight protein arginine phosphatase [Chloroflexota bacterium]
MDEQNPRKKILLVCGGNTCRSPMAKVIFEQKLEAIGKLDEFETDSAAYDGPTYQNATKEARQAMIALYGKDLLASHQAKKLTADLMQQADLILVMSDRMKKGLPAEKTYTLKEYAGETGSIADPFGGDVATYLKTAKEISNAADKMIPKLK